MILTGRAGTRFALAAFFAATLLAHSSAGAAKRLVLVKVDGLPADLMERYLDQTDPATGQSVLPWTQYIFVERGASLRNFYVRGISLSAPSWSMLDTGQHMTIRGNAEFDRFSSRVFDYLNFFPFYKSFAQFQQRVDMPGVEVLDQFGEPLLLSQFAPQERYQGFQLFQRGVRWTTLRDTITNRVLRPARDLVNEWQTGFEMSPGLEEAQEKELVKALADPKIVYLDFYSGAYDHSAHLTEDEPSQLAVLKQLDARLGRLWNAIQKSALASQTVLAMVSDHGMNSTPGVYSQGYSLVTFFNRADAGGHHVVTVRHPMTEFKLRGIDPFVSYVVTPSAEASYLRNQNGYPTVLLDPDGNERASVQLRNSDLNEIHILLLQLKRSDLDARQKAAVCDGILRIIDANRAVWTRTAAGLKEELTALLRAIERQRDLIARDPKKLLWPKEERVAQLDLAVHRHAVTLETWIDDSNAYKEYLQTVERLLNLTKTDLEAGHFQIESLIQKGVMGEPNSIGQLQNYVVSLAPAGLVFTAEGSLDLERTFRRVNYFAKLSGIRVRNAVQAEVGTAPVDFIAVRAPRETVAAALGPEDNSAKDAPDKDEPDSGAIFLCGDEEHEALLLSQVRAGTLWLRYLPVRGLSQDAQGGIHFAAASWAKGFPLHLFEDVELRVPEDRTAWLDAWHTERDWFEAIHRTRYSNGVIGLHEYFQQAQPVAMPGVFRVADESDWPVLRRFAARRRELTESDLLILAADHWNFNVRGFNPGGNHGSFLRISTHSVLMAAGGGVPAGLAIERPYDSLSFVPTVLSLIGRLPAEQKRSYPGPVIEELLPHPVQAHLATVTGASRD